MKRFAVMLFLCACGAEPDPTVGKHTADVVSSCTGMPDGTPCGTECTFGGACFANECLHTQPVPAGALCQSGNLCSTDDRCDGAGTCRPGGLIDCDDGDPSTSDSCDPAQGCLHNHGPRTVQPQPQFYSGGACSFACVTPSSPLGVILLSALAALAGARACRRA